MQRYANRAVEEHLTEYQKLFDRMWDWRKERDVLTRVIDQAIRTSQEYRKATSRAQRDSIYTALKDNAAWVDSMKQVAQQIEVGFVAIDPAAGSILAMVGGANVQELQVRAQPRHADPAPGRIGVQTVRLHGRDRQRLPSVASSC